MAFSSGSGGGRVMAEINVTPLVDVMLVLLIIFMITAPLMTHKVKVELPEANLDKRDPNKVQEVTPITIAVEDTGALYWNDEPVTKGVVESRFSVEAQKTPQPQVNVRGDKTAKYRMVQEIVQIAQAQGMRKVGFVAIKDRSGQQ
ncbi:MAG TPA: biopolymer transporter ExbD [Lysobacter sp.]|nr:biopolymer transporter ExbD [Lysobacter sp.]